MDILPPSLALAQAAEESGWGTSRFAREGNALFGQWTTDPDVKGLVPLAAMTTPPIASEPLTGCWTQCGRMLTT